jgi:hypothetical protein
VQAPGWIEGDTRRLIEQGDRGCLVVAIEAWGARSGDRRDRPTERIDTANEVLGTHTLPTGGTPAWSGQRLVFRTYAHVGALTE